LFSALGPLIQSVQCKSNDFLPSSFELSANCSFGQRLQVAKGLGGEPIRQASEDIVGVRSPVRRSILRVFLSFSAYCSAYCSAYAYRAEYHRRARCRREDPRWMAPRRPLSTRRRSRPRLLLAAAPPKSRPVFRCSRRRGMRLAASPHCRLPSL
jgi:hypothetical protein